jgi:hypothetical protein
MSKAKGKKNKRTASADPQGDPFVGAGLAPPGGAYSAGDLRTIHIHAKNFLDGIPQAETALTMMGRDAAHTVSQLAEADESKRLEELAKRLVALKPKVETNLQALRYRAVERHVEAGLRSALRATDVRDFTVSAGRVALFDPRRVADALAVSGRPRTDPERAQRGDIVWFHWTSHERIACRFFSGAPPEGQHLASGFLQVDSGVVFVGPPEAADGPRIGSVRLDPFSTGLDQHLPTGRLLQMRSGGYRVSSVFASERLHLYLERIEGRPTETQPLGSQVPVWVDDGNSSE